MWRKEFLKLAPFQAGGQPFEVDPWRQTNLRFYYGSNQRRGAFGYIQSDIYHWAMWANDVMARRWMYWVDEWVKERILVDGKSGSLYDIAILKAENADVEMYLIANNEEGDEPTYILTTYEALPLSCRYAEELRMRYHERLEEAKVDGVLYDPVIEIVGKEGFEKLHYYHTNCAKRIAIFREKMRDDLAPF